MPERLEPAASRARLENALPLPRKGVEPGSTSEPTGSGESVTEMQTASCTFAPLVMQQPSLLSGFGPLQNRPLYMFHAVLIGTWS